MATRGAAQRRVLTGWMHASPNLSPRLAHALSPALATAPAALTNRVTQLYRECARYRMSRYQSHAVYLLISLQQTPVCFDDFGNLGHGILDKGKLANFVFEGCSRHQVKHFFKDVGSISVAQPPFDCHLYNVSARWPLCFNCLTHREFEY